MRFASSEISGWPFMNKRKGSVQCLCRILFFQIFNCKIWKACTFGHFLDPVNCLQTLAPSRKYWMRNVPYPRASKFSEVLVQWSWCTSAPGALNSVHQVLGVQWWTGASVHNILTCAWPSARRVTKSGCRAAVAAVFCRRSAQNCISWTKSECISAKLEQCKLHSDALDL